jgi:hypothetical protein
MQVPFPELTFLRLFSFDETVIPDSFLGGSAPRLRYFELFGIPFPGLPKVLSSANHLVYLKLFNIPHSGYISPEAMAALLSALTSLRTLSLQFESPQSRPGGESRSLSPPKRFVLPALTELYFKGVTEYVEELVTRIDTPQLHEMGTTFLHQIDSDCTRLAQFIRRTPTLWALNEVHMQFANGAASVDLRHWRPTFDSTLYISISHREPNWQLLSIEQVCNSLHPLSTVEDLYIEQYWHLAWETHVIENTRWLDLLLPFTAVKNLYLFEAFGPGIAAALRELVEGGITEVLPNLQNIFVKDFEPSGPFRKNIEQFVATRQLSDHPISISVWE